jgi:hypothetical protein
VGPHHLAGIEPGVEVRVGRTIQALGERPLRAGIVLRLDREEAPNRLTGGRERRPYESLRDEPSPRDRLTGSGVRQR